MTRSASQSAVTCVAAGSWARIRCGILFERLPECGDILPQLADHDVAAVEAEIEEAFGSAARRQPVPGAVAHRPAPRDRAPSRCGRWYGRAESRPSGTPCQGSCGRDLPSLMTTSSGAGILAVRVEGNWLRQSVGETEMLAAQRPCVEAEGRAAAVNDPDER